MPADAGHIEAAQDSFARCGELIADGAEVGVQKLAIALGEAAGDHNVAHACTRPLHDDGGHGIMHRPHGERPQCHDGDVGLLAGRETADAIAHLQHCGAARRDPVERFMGRYRGGVRYAAAARALGGIVERALGGERDARNRQHVAVDRRFEIDAQGWCRAQGAQAAGDGMAMAIGHLDFGRHREGDAEIDEGLELFVREVVAVHDVDVRPD